MCFLKCCEVLFLWYWHGVLLLRGLPLAAPHEGSRRGVGVLLHPLCLSLAGLLYQGFARLAASVPCMVCTSAVGAFRCYFLLSLIFRQALVFVVPQTAYAASHVPRAACLGVAELVALVASNRI